MAGFLELAAPEKFFHLLHEHCQTAPKGTEVVAFTDALHRVIARNIYSPVNLPAFDRSTVDGFAIRAADSAGASESLPGYLTVVGEVLMGETAEMVLKPGQAIKIATGGMLPTGADAVLMVEYTDYLDGQTIEFTRPVAVLENVVKKGEDIAEAELLLARGHVLRPQDIGALAGLGILQVEVFKRPEVAILSTGDELIHPAAEPSLGQIRDINSYSIGAVLEEMGCRVRMLGIVQDTFDTYCQVVRENLSCDLILVSGGSSVGVKDMTIDVLNSLGTPGVLVHGVAIKPGKPTILASVNGTPVIGLPGHPASAWTIFTILVKPLIMEMKGQTTREKPEEKIPLTVDAVLSRNLVSDKGKEEYVSVRLVPNLGSGKESTDSSQSSPQSEVALEPKYIAEPIPGKSSLITTLVQADGFIRVDTFREGLNKGKTIKVRLY